ncbi:MAG: hypothetical protein A2Y03_06520 [Omnitrophica WOR_2 bacterium GWF2_38_59]|nr:MAG: hypothetical protein A2Y03_06520 [Omnitrophica WOR_2 bacterium GWF2_38_59]OGX50495.1 MAG: hypothetical protein A2243_02055 [Omnitrophica WOR_2 bacterium RIFOXYA2_FULL_38_17]OGX59504.1 MAG: hypothetical protein A2306_09680 [Omnitrophica WOR_2 bacterium RIFOXYB2_FULL_38_16]
MKVIIHRGTKEIGGSCVELKTDKTRILIDFGMPLVDVNQEPFDSKSILGKTIEELKKLKILPDIKGLYKDEEKNIDAVLISHAHLDHYGLLKYVNPNIPIYMSEGAKQMIEASDVFIPNKVGKINSRVIAKYQKTAIGDLEVTPYLVDHSAFDALAFLIEAEEKKLFYSGDFRAHGRKSVLFEKIISDPPRNIDVLLMEGSMLGRGEQIYKDETAVEEVIEGILRQKKNIAFLFASSQNIDRLVSAYRACLRTDSIFVIDIYTAFVLNEIGNISTRIPQFSWKNIRVKYFKSHADSLAETDHKELLYIFNKKKIELEEISEKRRKILMLMRHNSLFPVVIKKIDNIKEAVIIYSMWQGYLTHEFEEYCRKKEIEIKQVHTSGHATIEALKAFSDAINPKTLIPIHTFNKNEYLSLFKNVTVLNDGESFVLRDN